jgi:hypothetical protein
METIASLDAILSYMEIKSTIAIFVAVDNE